MKAATHKSAVEPTRHSAVKSAHRSTAEAACHKSIVTSCHEPAPVKTTAAVGYEAIAMESPVESIMHVEVVMNITTMREVTAMRVVATVKPAREWIEKRRRNIPAIIWVVRVIIRIRVTSSDVSHRRTCIIRISGRRRLRRHRRGLRSGRRSPFSNHGRLRCSLRRAGSCRSRLVTQFPAALEHGCDDLRRNSFIAQLDDFIRARFKRSGRSLDERKHN